jgi:hypothetical protein
VTQLEAAALIRIPVAVTPVAAALIRIPVAVTPVAVTQVVTTPVAARLARSSGFPKVALVPVVVPRAG